MLSFPRQRAASFLKAESRFSDIRRITLLLEPDQAHKKTCSAFTEIPAGCRCQLLWPGSSSRARASLLCCERCIPAQTAPGSQEPQRYPRRGRSSTAKAFPEHQLAKAYTPAHIQICSPSPEGNGSCRSDSGGGSADACS